ncbi:MAG: PqqD family protein [Pseudonocardiaceae bacterium]
MTQESERLLKLREGAVAWQQVDGETIMLDLAASTYLGVNHSGSVLWPALVDGSTREDLVVCLCETYDVSEEKAAVDVDVFLRTCQERGFLES